MKRRRSLPRGGNRPTNLPPITHPVRGWLLYDDACGFCRRWMLFWAPTLRQHGYDIAPLQSDWVRAGLGEADATLLVDFRLWRGDGTQVRGADAYRDVLRRIWWAYPLFLLTRLPILRQLFNLGYRTFAANRFRFSQACGLGGRTAE